MLMLLLLSAGFRRRPKRTRDWVHAPAPACGTDAWRSPAGPASPRARRPIFRSWLIVLVW